jgi:hypothetical protein
MKQRTSRLATLWQPLEAGFSRRPKRALNIEPLLGDDQSFGCDKKLRRQNIV